MKGFNSTTFSTEQTVESVVQVMMSMEIREGHDRMIDASPWPTGSISAR
jgi:hypothetical protein